MRAVFALVHASWLSMRSYRLRLLLSIGGLMVSVVPLYFIATALQPVMADKIAGEGGEFFAFLMLGTVTFVLLPSAINSMAGAVSSGINTGVLEALLGTGSRLPAVLAGMTGFDLLWTALRACVMLLGAWLFGASILWSHALSGIFIAALIVLAYLPFGLINAAMIIVFRTTGPLPSGVLTLSVLLGGVYYPTHVIPSWIQHLSVFVPLTYGLRALRATMLEGTPLAGVLPEVATLVLFIVVLMGIGSTALVLAMRHARRTGTLTQY